MVIRRLNRGEAEKAMSEWIATYPQLPPIDGEYALLRNDLLILFQSVTKSAEDKGLAIKDYYVDSQFGIHLYMYLRKTSWFSLRLAADDGFWRYLSLKVIPDVVAARWGKDNESHYWSTPVRIWLKQLWWYIYLSWKTDEATTRKIIESPNCSTDTILNFVERAGKKGTCVDAYRWIIYFYSILPSDMVSEYKKRDKKHDLFRVVMKLNTARKLVIEPALCADGCEGYAKKLYLDSGFDIDAALEQYHRR
jgi:hypothetical protein